MSKDSGSGATESSIVGAGGVILVSFQASPAWVDVDALLFPGILGSGLALLIIVSLAVANWNPRQAAQNDAAS